MNNGKMGLRAQCKKWRIAERGVSSIVIFILGMPMILMAFGFGIDIMRVGYAKRVMQSRLDVAVQAGASLSYTTARGAVRLGVPANGQQAAASVLRAQQVYLDNTRNFRGTGSAQNRARGALFYCTESDVSLGTGRNPFNTRNPANPNQDRELYSNPQLPCRGGAYPIYTGPNDTAAPAGQRIGPPPDFNFCQRPGSGKYGIKYEIVEQIPTIFLRMAGGPQFFDIHVSSEALLRQQYC